MYKLCTYAPLILHSCLKSYHSISVIVMTPKIGDCALFVFEYVLVLLLFVFEYVPEEMICSITYLVYDEVEVPIYSF